MSYARAMSRAVAGAVFALAALSVPKLHAMEGESPLDALRAVARANFTWAEAAARCRTLGTPQAMQVESVYAMWRARYRVVPIADGGVVTPQLREEMTQEARKHLSWRQLHYGNVEALCASYVGNWQGPDFDMHLHHPAAYDAAGGPVSIRAAERAHERLMATARATATRQPALWKAALDRRHPHVDLARREIDEPPQPVRPIAPLHSVGQLQTVVEEWLRTGQKRALSTRVYVRARIAQRGPLLVLVDANPIYDTHESFPARGFTQRDVGREVVIGAVLYLIGNTGALDYERLVDNTRGLTPSKLPATFTRRTAKKSAITTAPGKGLPSSQIVTVLHHVREAGNRESEEVYVLLRDGWAYRRKDVAPEDLNVSASRRYEPEQWTRWRSTGAQGYSLPGRPIPRWPAGMRLSGIFESNLAWVGDIRASTWITFAPDGSFQSTRSTSGSVVFDSTPTSGSALRIRARGVEPFANGVLNADCGRAGSYHLDGYVLELRYDDGARERMLSFPIQQPTEGVFLSSRPFERCSY